MSTAHPARIKIMPSVLAADFGRINAEVRAVTRAGADGLHLDIMDGHFVPALTFGPQMVAAIRRATRVPLTLHLMIDNADAQLSAYAAARPDEIWVHAEAVPDLPATIARIRGLGIRAGVAIRPGTSPSVVAPVIEQVDTVLVMSVEPGLGGQPFMASVLPKIGELRRLGAGRDRPLEIAIDGGITPATIGAAAAAGADTFVAGSAVFGRPSYREAIKALRAGAEAARRQR